MTVPARIYDLSATAASNSPAGSESIGTSLDDYLRAGFAIIRGDLATKGADIASATTTDLGAVQGLMHDITGTTTITGFGTVAAGVWKIIKFEGALTLTHNATSLILLTAANRTTGVGDVGMYISEGSGNWRELFYAPAGVSLTKSGVAFPATQVASTDANTLDDYEETDFSGSISDGSGAALSFSAVAAYATKVGDRVSFSVTVTYPATADGSNAQINGLPYSVNGDVCLAIGDNSGASLQAYAGSVAAGAISICTAGTFTRVTNASLSGKKLYISGTYRV